MFNRIYDKHKMLITLTWIISFIICLLCLLFIFLEEFVEYENFVEFIKNFISGTITFISISFGFYLTNLSILFSSKYIKMLYKEDKNKPTQRQIHTIKEYFKLAIYCALITIGVSFVVLFGIIFKDKYTLIILFSLLLAFFIENFIFIYLLLKVFINTLIVQARPDNQGN